MVRDEFPQIVQHKDDADIAYLWISTEAAFYEAQAIILSNMGQHKKALEIYVFKMQDYGKAEE